MLKRPAGWPGSNANGKPDCWALLSGLSVGTWPELGLAVAGSVGVWAGVRVSTGGCTCLLTVAVARGVRTFDAVDEPRMGLCVALVDGAATVAVNVAPLWVTVVKAPARIKISPTTAASVLSVRRERFTKDGRTLCSASLAGVVGSTTRLVGSTNERGTSTWGIWRKRADVSRRSANMLWQDGQVCK